MWLRSEDLTKTSTRAKEPIIEVDLDADREETVEESSGETEEADPNAFELVKRNRDDEASGSTAVEQDPQKDVGREKFQKVRRSKCPRQACVYPVSIFTAELPTATAFNPYSFSTRHVL